MPQLSFRVTNLLVPGDPQQIAISTPSGGWKLVRVEDYARVKTVITAARGRQASELPIVDTYILVHANSGESSSTVDEKAWDELTPILLAASFATGMSVTIRDGTLAGPRLLNSPTQWPRPRAMDGPSWVVNVPGEFQALVSAFVKSWPDAGQKEKALLLVHHWLDALACWSMEDLYLSATTLLQVIATTEKRKRLRDRKRARKGRQLGKKEPLEKLFFHDALKAASSRVSISHPSPQVKEMRDSLVHEGTLRGKWMEQVDRTRLAGIGKDADDGGDRLTDHEICARIVAEVMNWLDTYIHAALRLGRVAKTRFAAYDFTSLNAYSLP